MYYTGFNLVFVLILYYILPGTEYVLILFYAFSSADLRSKLRSSCLKDLTGRKFKQNIKSGAGKMNAIHDYILLTPKKEMMMFADL